jgi:hypothetical protein
VFGLLSPRCMAIFHTVAFLCDVAFLSTDAAFGSPSYPFAGIYVYLTIWGLTFQTLYFGVAALSSWLMLRELPGEIEPVHDSGVTPFNSVCGDGSACCSCRGEPSEAGIGPVERYLSLVSVKLLAVRDRLFSLEIALSLFISTGFWVLLFPDPATQAKWASDHVAAMRSCYDHGMTLVWMLLELSLVRHRYSRNKWLGLSIASLFGAVYLGWNVLTHSENNRWPYPSVQQALERLGVGIEVVGYGAGVLLIAGLWMFGRWLHVGCLWGRRSEACSQEACCLPSCSRRQADDATDTHTHAKLLLGSSTASYNDMDSML